MRDEGDRAAGRRALRGVAWPALLLCLAVLVGPLLPAMAQDAGEAAASDAGIDAAGVGVAADDGRLPAPVTTRHRLDFGDRVLAFAATAGALTLTDRAGTAEAEIGFVAYVLDDATVAARPVTVAVNGGPGAASAYLHLGVLGPWRLPVGVATIVPSQPVALVANPETWLDFTDLVFLDPVGTGFSRLIEPDDRLRGRYLSVEGDVDALAEAIYRWLVNEGRIGSPKYFIGESYGGFRGPLVAAKLQRELGVGLSGMTLLSPVLDFGWRTQPAHNPLARIALLPSLAAAAMAEAEAEAGTLSPEALAEVEAYAAGDYLLDLVAGLGDAAAVGRLVERVAAITGLEPEVVARHAGRLEMQDFAAEAGRADGRVLSLYDTAVTADDPTPERPFSRAPDPVLDALTAPLTSAALAHYRDTLKWLPERRYVLLGAGVNRAWDWGDGRRQPEAVSDLRRVMALDPSFRVLVAHGLTDLVTPYFESELILRQIPAFGPGERLRQATYLGGHMFYTRDGSRRAFRDDALWLYGVAE